MSRPFKKVKTHIIDAEGYRKVKESEIIELKNCISDVSLRTNAASAIERAWKILNAIQDRTD